MKTTYTVDSFFPGCLNDASYDFDDYEDAIDYLAQLVEEEQEDGRRFRFYHVVAGSYELCTQNETYERAQDMQTGMVHKVEEHDEEWLKLNPQNELAEEIADSLRADWEGDPYLSVEDMRDVLQTMSQDGSSLYAHYGYMVSNRKVEGDYVVWKEGVRDSIANYLDEAGYYDPDARLQWFRDNIDVQWFKVECMSFAIQWEACNLLNDANWDLERREEEGE